MTTTQTATDWLKASQTFEANLGRQYPPEFLRSLAFQGSELVLAWLIANHAPAEICELAEQIGVLNVFMPDIEARSLNDVSALQITQIVPEFLARLIDLGGLPEWPTVTRP